MIAIEFTEDEVAIMASGWRMPEEIRDKFSAALPLEEHTTIEALRAEVTQLQLENGRLRAIVLTSGISQCCAGRGDCGCLVLGCGTTGHCPPGPTWTP